MAQVEFSQQFYETIPTTASTVFYFPLQSVAGVYVIKSLSCFCTQAIAALPGSLSFLSSPDQFGTGQYLINCTSNAITANENIPIFTPLKQMIIKNPYLGMAIQVSTAPADIFVNISYSFIPYTNYNYDNFDCTYSVVTDTTGASFTGLSATQATIMKAITVVNIAPTASTVTPQITTNGVTMSIGAPKSVATNSTYTVEPVIYLNSTQTLSFVVVGKVIVIYSYTQDLNS